MAQSFGILLVIFLLAFLVESMVEYAFGTPLKKLGKGNLTWLLMYISMAAGVALAFWYHTDLIYLLAQSVGAERVPESWVGYILTGMGIGRGANWLHQLVSEYFPAKK